MDALVKRLVVKESNRAVLSQAVNDNLEEEERESWLYNLVCAVEQGTCTVKTAVDALRRGENIFSDDFLEARMRLKDETDLIVKGVEVEEGVLACPKCGCRKVCTDIRQTRGLDESATVRATCTKCKNKWTASHK